MANDPRIFYLVGALRDGCLTTQNTIKIKQKSREWLTKVLIPLFSEVFDRSFRNNVYFQKGKYPCWYLAFKDKRIWLTLKRFSKRLPKTKREQRYYVMGFWDADGGCPKDPLNARKLYIKFTQKDRISLMKIKEVLENFGIRTGSVRISEISKMVPYSGYL